MIEREFEDAEGSEAVGFSHGDFGFVVEAFDAAAGKLFLCPEVIENEVAVFAEGSGDLLQGLDAGPHGLAALFVGKLSSPGGGVILPELLKGFLEKVSADCLEIEAEQIAKAEALPPGEKLVACFRPFLEWHAVTDLSRKTIRRYVDNLWAPGGESIRDINETPSLRKLPAERLLLKPSARMAAPCFLTEIPRNSNVPSIPPAANFTDFSPTLSREGSGDRVPWFR